MTEGSPHSPPTLQDAPPPHVLVVDDDDRLRELLRRYLAENGFLVATASDAAQARAKLMSLAFDVIVLDLMMPGESGLDFAESLRREGSLPILMLTAMDTVEDRIAGLERGADDYLVKPFEPRELVLRLKAILRRSESAPTEPVRFGDFTFDAALGELRNAGVPVDLTAAEAGLLRALTETTGAPVSRERLSETTRVATRSVDVQITRLRRKIELNPRDPRYLVTVRGEGYALRVG
jgi:two-component system phosphate regulon response regulator OmpR